jgi:hypothetical protein
MLQYIDNVFTNLMGIMGGLNNVQENHQGPENHMANATCKHDPSYGALFLHQNWLPRTKGRTNCSFYIAMKSSPVCLFVKKRTNCTYKPYKLQTYNLI